MSKKRYTEEFKKEAVKQVTERGYSVADVAQRLGTTTHSLYAWLKKYGEPSPQQANQHDLATENSRFHAVFAIQKNTSNGKSPARAVLRLKA